MGLRLRVLPIALFFALCQLSFGQTHDWATVKLLLPGQNVKVVTADGRSRAGSVRSVSEDSIQLGKHSIRKEDVRQVLLRAPGHRGRHALIGLGIGAGAGVGLGFATPLPENDTWDSRGQEIAFAVPFCAAIGAGIGALLPAHRAWHEVYRSE